MLSGAYLGIAAALTAFSVNRHPEFVAGPQFSEPFTQNQQVFFEGDLRDVQERPKR